MLKSNSVKLEMGVEDSVKADWILDKVRERKAEGGKVLVYTQYVGGIVDELAEKLEDADVKVGVYTGKNKSGLKKFLDGKLDVLIGSSAISTGIDGLQRVCSDMIFLSLPFTDAEFVQAVGRVHRQGQVSDKVQVWIPMVKQTTVSGEHGG